jgi:hypothetical protein
MRLEVHGALSIVGVVVVCHLGAMMSGSKGVRGASVAWCVLRGQKVPTMWVSHSLGLLALHTTLLYPSHPILMGRRGLAQTLVGLGCHLCPSLLVD